MPRHPSKLRTGDPAPALVLPDEEDRVFDLARVRGRPTLVSFLSHAA